MYNRELMVSYVNSGHRKYLAIINERWSHGTLIDEGSDVRFGSEWDGKMYKGQVTVLVEGGVAWAPHVHNYKIVIW